MLIFYGFHETDKLLCDTKISFYLYEIKMLQLYVVSYHSLLEGLVISEFPSNLVFRHRGLGGVHANIFRLHRFSSTTELL